MPLRIVEGADPFQVCSGWDEFTTPEQAIPQREVGLQEECRVLGALSETEKLLPQRLRRLERCPYPIKSPQAP